LYFYIHDYATLVRKLKPYTRPTNMYIPKQYLSMEYVFKKYSKIKYVHV